jgi:hypothetical protein
MTDLDPQWDASSKPSRWPLLVALGVISLLLLGFLIASLGKDKNSDVIKRLDGELTAQKSELTTLQEDLYQQKKDLDGFKERFDRGLVDDRKRGLAEYNDAKKKFQADSQRFKDLADQYNRKVTEYRNAGGE